MFNLAGRFRLCVSRSLAREQLHTNHFYRSQNQEFKDTCLKLRNFLQLIWLSVVVFKPRMKGMCNIIHSVVDR